MTNNEIRALLMSNGIRMWELADELNIREATLSRWWRYELDTEHQRKVLQAMDNIMAKRSQTSKTVQSPLKSFYAEQQQVTVTPTVPVQTTTSYTAPVQKAEYDTLEYDDIPDFDDDI